jgi:hypothetical protein
MPIYQGDGSGTASFQSLSGKKTSVADDTWTEFAFSDHSFDIIVTVYANYNAANNGGIVKSMSTHYGSAGSSTTLSTYSFGVVDGVDVQYLNSGGSQNYVMRLKVDTSGGETTTVGWNIQGYSSSKMIAK